MRLDRCDLNVPHDGGEHVRDHHLVQCAVREPNESGVLIRSLSSLLVHGWHLVRLVRILLLCNVEVVVDEEGSKRDGLLVPAMVQLVRNHSSVLAVDGLLVRLLAEGQVVDLVGEIDLKALLDQLHDDVGAVVRRQMEVARDFVHTHFTFDLATLFVLKLPLCCAKDHIGWSVR